MSNKKFPKYVKIVDLDKNNICALELDFRYPVTEIAKYWKNAGKWGCTAGFVNNKLVIIDVDYKRGDHLKGKKLIKTSKLEWMNNNYGYV